ncbi:MAG TPA: EamA family transporter [Steroidobacteraceae bacterium]|nr:EamA family transporter [Steroidobacteraceae bacterium]
MTSSRTPLPATLLAFTAIYVIWGTTFLCITLTLRTMPAFLSGAVRFLIAGGLMYAWLRSREPRPFAGLHAGGTALCGVLLTGIGNGFVIWSQLALPSGIAALFVGALPVSILLLDWMFFSRRTPRPLAVLGVALGLAGVTVLSLNTRAIAHNARPIYVIAALTAELAWALGTLLQPRYVGAARVRNFTCLQMLVGAGFQLLMSLVDREWIGFAPSRVSLQSLLALAYLILFGSIIAFSCYSYLVAHVAAQKISTYALVNPVIALALGAAVLGERVTPAAIVATLLVLAGVALVLLQREPVRDLRALRPGLAAVERAEP